MHLPRTAAPLLGLTTLAALVLAARPADAQTTVYDNTTTPELASSVNGGASGASATTIIADDLTPAPGFSGSLVTQFTFSIVNTGTAPITVTPTVYFFSDDGAGGGPGSLLAVVPYRSVVFSGRGAYAIPISNSAGFFTLPAGTLWAGVAYSGASADLLNGMGQVLYGPPTVGSSQDHMFFSSGPATSANNPAGSITPFQSGPVANHYWTIQVTPAPELSQNAALSLGTLALAGMVLKARKRKATDA